MLSYCTLYFSGWATPDLHILYRDFPPDYTPSNCNQCSRPPNEVMQQFQAEGFRIEPHKAYQFARDTAQIRLLFCSEMENELAQMLLLNPIKNLQIAVNMALADMQPGERVGVLPYATSTIPYLK